ncbi:Dyp-type peroxidase [Streptomyces gamaensis]|uniref:Dyp-type peroxidase n=1 Tax=Streptomyces gamaensis TaxID=1763542 RepID=A0ABW0Z1V3_9ACTN
MLVTNAIKKCQNGVMNQLTGIPRRGLLMGGALAAAATLTACRSQDLSSVPASPTAPQDSAAPVGATGPVQAGVDRPGTPQEHLGLAVFDLGSEREPSAVARLLAELGRTIGEVTGGRHQQMAGLAPGDVTVTVGVGPALVAGVPGVRSDLPGAAQLPRFAREQIPDAARDGDVLLQVCGSDPLVVSCAEAACSAVLAGAGAQVRWSQRGFRPPAGPHAGRNLLGFPDGIIVPKGPEQMRREVWLDGPEPVTGGTVAVVRRLRIDTDRFLAQPVRRQEEAIGRRRADGAPLSGGDAEAEVDLGAKTPDGRYLVPPMAHARRANPLTSGSGLMLRRSYSYRNGPEDAGLVFISFQRELRTFVATQQRLDEGDDLMAFTTATASGTFLVLPGFDAQRPLGSALFGT